MNKKISVEECTNEQDWIAIRSCLLRSFFSYPLYERLIPNLNTRGKFLEKVLQANYDVAVKNGNSVVFSISLDGEIKKKVDIDSKSSKSNKTVIGGIMIVPPNKDGDGWDCPEDKVFNEVYAKYGLKDIDRKAFERMLKHEEWETDLLQRKVCPLNLYLWQVYFWGIDPNYSKKGYGSACFTRCLQLINKIPERKISKRIDQCITENGYFKEQTLNSTKNKTKNASFLIESHGRSQPKPSMVLLMTYDYRSAKFYEKNGSMPVASIPVMDEGTRDSKQENVTRVHILLAESQYSGQLHDIATRLALFFKIYEPKS